MGTIPAASHWILHAKVILADLAFVRLRHGLDQFLLEGKTSFSQSVAAQLTLGPAHLVINLKTRQFIAHGKTIKLIPADLAFYIWLLDRQQNKIPAPYCPSDGAPDETYAEQFLYHYQRIHGEMGGADRTIETMKDGMSKSFFEQRKSRINKILTKHFRHSAAPYLIRNEGGRPRTRYRIALELDQIEIQQEING